MVEAVKDARLRVNIEILRPATYKALTERLTERGAGYYHVLHFDGHGALMTYEDYLTGFKGDRLSFQRGYGLGNLAEYAGSKAFLSFEGDAKGQSVYVEAAELTALLQGKQIPICILNACQSAMQLADGRETSLGSQLMAAGMQAVVAMGYSVTVTAARVLMTKLYKELFGGKDFATAVRLGRYELYNDKQRRGGFNTWIDLEDWLLPVVYGSSAVDLNLREFAPAEEEAYYAGLGSRYRFTLPSYGFVGRDLDILKIEKGLLRHNVLLLRGMGGTGKTTLLGFLREWWQTTNFADDVFYFGYDERAWTLTQILYAIGQRIYDKFENARFGAMSVAAQVPKLAEKLRSGNYIVVLDNLESVTGQQLAIQNTLNAVEQEELRKFLALLVGGKTRVVLGSRAGEEWLQGVFRQNVYVLRGLDLEARSDLAELILQRQVAASRVKEIREDADFGRLMGLLAGYPLAMEVVLANLRRQSPGEVLGALRLADVGLDGAGQDKTTSILKCVEYSHSNLSEAAQRLLLCLAPFSSFIWRDGIPLYVEELKKLEPFKDYDFAGFDDAIQEAINWGLLSPINDINDSLLSMQPVFPYFLQTRIDQAISETTEALTNGFKNYYHDLANAYITLLISKNPQERQLGIFYCHLEYENLYCALQICLNNHEDIDIYICLYKYFEVTNDTQSRLKISKKTYYSLENYPPELVQGILKYQIACTCLYLANCYTSTNSYSEAEIFCRKALAVCEKLVLPNNQLVSTLKASIYDELGKISGIARKWNEARNYHYQALSIYVEFHDLWNQASVYNSLGVLASELLEWKKAKENYHQALGIYTELGDQHSQALVYYNFGRIARQSREWDEARCNYHKSLKIYVEFGDNSLQAKTYMELGAMASDLRAWNEAQQNYHRALGFYIKLNDQLSQANVYSDLGAVNLILGDHEDSLNNYYKALEIKIECGERYSQAIVYHSLGVIYQELREWNKALNNFKESIVIKAEFGDRYSQAMTYYGLGVMHHRLQELSDARNNYSQALEILIEFDDRYSQAAVYHCLGQIDFDLKEINEAEQKILQALQIWTEYQDKHNIHTCSLPILSHIYQTNQSLNLHTRVAAILKYSEAEVQQLFDLMNQST